MVRLSILSGKTAGTAWVARRFPVRIGRARSADLCLEEPGVWDQHLMLGLDNSHEFVLETEENALAVVNGQDCQHTTLRNGDLIEIGSVKLQFWIGETTQTGLRLREGLTWAAIAAICLGQVGLIYWLAR